MSSSIRARDLNNNNKVCDVARDFSPQQGRMQGGSQDQGRAEGRACHVRVSLSPMISEFCLRMRNKATKNMELMENLGKSPSSVVKRRKTLQRSNLEQRRPTDLRQGQILMSPLL